MSPALLEVRDLCVDFGRHRVLDGVSLGLAAGETLGLVGESGAGKSTLARAILRLVPARGAIRWRGEELLGLPAPELRRRRRELQMIFQDALASLDPRMTVGDILAEPLRVFEPAIGAAARRLRIGAMLDRVGLPAAAMGRYPHEFSGGQCQRIGIARAMMLTPALVIADEPVSALDVSIQGQIVNLLLDFQVETGSALLFISHNLAVVRHICRRVLVLYAGRIIESAPTEALFAGAVHPYTRALIAAVPDPDRAGNAAPAALAVPAEEPEPAGAVQAAGGCAFRGRCPFAETRCAAETPSLQPIGAQHEVACHRRGELVYS